MAFKGSRLYIKKKHTHPLSLCNGTEKGRCLPSHEAALFAGQSSFSSLQSPQQLVEGGSLGRERWESSARLRFSPRSSTGTNLLCHGCGPATSRNGLQTGGIRVRSSDIGRGPLDQTRSQSHTAPEFPRRSRQIGGHQKQNIHTPACCTWFSARLPLHTEVPPASESLRRRL